VGLAEHLRERYGSTIHAEIFENHHGGEAHREILRLVGASAGDASNGAMTEAAKKAARIVLYGHSWGASEAVAMARQLERDGVPVLLVVQVDGVPKLGEDDAVIPANVAQAVNFYQLDGLLHGRRRIRAADPAATTILGNFRLAYKDSSVACPGYPWYTRAFTKPHIEIENDPRVWNKVEALILSNLILSKATP
jgi:pimeloyl-ACP methyl ester carboxylesterase